MVRLHRAADDLVRAIRLARSVLQLKFVHLLLQRLLGLSADAPWPDTVEAALTALPGGHGFTVPDVLFAKIADERREALEARFAGAG